MTSTNIGRRIATLELKLIEARLAKDKRSIAFFRRSLAIAKLHIQA